MLEKAKDNGTLYIYPSGMLQAFKEVLPLVKKLTIPAVSKSVCHCDERDRVEEDGELYCIKCGSKWD